MEHIVKILFSEFVTHDVKRIIIEKPKGFSFVPGNATNAPDTMKIEMGIIAHEMPSSSSSSSTTTYK